MSHRVICLWHEAALLKLRPAVTSSAIHKMRQSTMDSQVPHLAYPEIYQLPALQALSLLRIPLRNVAMMSREPSMRTSWLWLGRNHETLMVHLKYANQAYRRWFLMSITRTLYMTESLQRLLLLMSPGNPNEMSCLIVLLWHREAPP